MRDAYPEFRRLGMEVGAVSFGNAKVTRRFCTQQGVPFPCFADPERRAYDAFGLARRPSWRRVLDPRQARRYVAAIRAGHRAYKGELSIRQMPGTFLIDSSGKLRYEHRNGFPADNPPVAELIAAARSL